MFVCIMYKCISLRQTHIFYFFFTCCHAPRKLHSFPTRRSSDLSRPRGRRPPGQADPRARRRGGPAAPTSAWVRSEEHTSELQSLRHLVCRLLLEKKKK